MSTNPSPSRERQLERALARQSQVLAEYAAALQAVQQSRAWRLVWIYSRLRDKLLPPGSARQRVFERFVRQAFDLLEGLFRRTGKGPTLPIEGSGVIDDTVYRLWRAKHEGGAAEILRQRLRPPVPAPMIAVVPVGIDADSTTEPSVRGQTYPHWEYCPAGATLPSAGKWVALVAAGDVLAPSALFEAVSTLNASPEADLLYADDDELGHAGRRSPCFKPEWSLELLRGTPYTGRFLVVRRALFDELGGPRPEMGSASLFDFTLRAGERAHRVLHVPKVLSHARPTPPPTPAELVRTVSEHLQRVGEIAKVSTGVLPGTCRVVYPLPRRPVVSVIVPNRDSAELLDRCLTSVRAVNWPELDVIVVENGSSDAETLALYGRLRRDGVRILDWPGTFNYAAINNLAVREARGELLLFLNNDIQAPEGGDWLAHLARHALRPDVGAVGAKLLYADGAVQHAGVVLGLFGVAGHGHSRFPRSAPGHLGQLQLAREVSAVTGACLLVRKRVFDEVGGFDETFAVAYNDVDLCLRLRQRGYRTIWTPEAELFHLESMTRGTDDTPAKRQRLERERTLFVARWRKELEAGDPFYSPLLRVDGTDYGLRR